MKLALDGLAGVKSTTVTLGHAIVVYDPTATKPATFVTAVNDGTQFQAEVKSDGPATDADVRVPASACLLRWLC